MDSNDENKQEPTLSAPPEKPATEPVGADAAPQAADAQPQPEVPPASAEAAPVVIPAAEEAAAPEPPGAAKKERKQPRELTPHEKRRVERLQSKGSPFRGIRGRYIFLVELFELVLFLPGFINSRAAREIVATGRGRIYGFSDLVYLYPIVPVTIICSIIAVFTKNMIILEIMGLTWSVVTLTAIATLGEDISGKLVGAVIGTIIALGVAWVVLQVTGSVDINRGLWKFVTFFHPVYSSGITNFVALGVAALLIYSGVKSRVHQELNICGNRWNPSRLHTEASFDSENHRIYARTPDWAERVWYHCRDLAVVPILEAKNLQQGELEEKAVFMLQNVPAGRRVYEAIEFAAAIKDVEVTV